MIQSAQISPIDSLSSLISNKVTYLGHCYKTLSHLVVSDSLWPNGLQQARLLWPSLSPWVCSNSCPLSQWCHPTISFSVTPFSSCPQFFPESGSFIVSRLFTSSGQSIWASLLPMNILDWFPLGLTGLISLQSKGSSRVSSSTTLRKHHFFGCSK